MMRRSLRSIALFTALAFTASCATILYPERKGNNQGPLDVVPLVVDILLFIPGILPGVIALVVDFGTGAIYMNRAGGGKKSDAPTGGEALAAQHRLLVEVIDDEGRVLESQEIDVKRRDAMAVMPDLRAYGPDARLRLTADDHAPVVLAH